VNPGPELKIAMAILFKRKREEGEGWMRRGRRGSIYRSRKNRARIKRK
jgi:hypothetical protein